MDCLPRFFDDLLCAVCQDCLLDPRPLPCGHSFCAAPSRPCLSSLALLKTKSARCAVCRALHEVDTTEIKPLYGIREFLEKLPGATEEAGIIAPVKIYAQKPCPKHPKFEGSLYYRFLNIYACEDCVFGLYRYPDPSIDLVRLRLFFADQIEKGLGKSLKLGIPELLKSLKKFRDLKGIELQLLNPRIASLEGKSGCDSAIEELKSMVSLIQTELERSYAEEENLQEYIRLGSSDENDRFETSRDETMVLLNIWRSSFLQKLRNYDFAEELIAIHENLKILASLEPKSTRGGSSQPRKQIKGTEKQPSLIAQKEQSQVDESPNIADPPSIPCSCGSNPNTSEKLQSPLGLKASLHVISRSPLVIGASSKLTYCQIEFSISAGLRKRRAVQLDSTSEQSDPTRYFKILINYNRTLKSTVETKFKFKISLHNETESKTLVSNGPAWVIRENSHVFWLTTIAHEQLIDPKNGWIKQVNGRDYIHIDLELTQ